MEATGSSPNGQDFFGFAARHHAARFGMVDVNHAQRRTFDRRPQPATEKRPAKAAHAASGHAPSPASGLSDGGGAGAAHAAPPAAGSAYLEQYRIPVTVKTIAVACGCKSRFCERCCLALGIKLKQKLIPILETFKRVMMLTFTIDPQHFAGPAEAFEHVKKARCLSVTMQALRRAGVLITDRWFAVIEWQENGWPHWHVLVEAQHIPFPTLAAAWNVNLAKLGKTADQTRVGFGSVRFTVSRFNSGKHAAGYACAYLTKHPKHGYPEWVLDSLTRKVHRYSASRGLWNAADGKVSDALSPDEAEDVGDRSDAGEDADQQDSHDEPARRTISQQLATCGQSTMILRELEEADPITGELVRRYVFLEKINRPLADVLMSRLHRDLNNRGTRAELLEPSEKCDA